jgi:hypothetical protein
MITAIFLAALIVALVDEFIQHGRSLTGWAVVLLAIGLLWGRLG